MKTESKLPVPRFKIKLPEKIPINNDITTFLVINANAIATNGGHIVNTPNFDALSVTAFSVAKTAIDGIINTAKVNKNA